MDDRPCKGFIDILEIVYAILMSWGFAKVSENLLLSGQFFVSNHIYIFCFLVVVFVLIRFFFVPSLILQPLVASEKKRHLIVLLDIPIALFHSFLYFKMCYSLVEKNYNIFFTLLAILLFVNSVWLDHVYNSEPRAEKEVKKAIPIWVKNNLICSFLLLFFCMIAQRFQIYINLWLYVCVLIALYNCGYDLWRCAGSYFKAE